MFRKTNVELVNLTRDFATEVARMPALPGERELKPSHVAHLTNIIRAGRFASPTWAMAIDATTSRKFRANGYHSSTALSNLPADVAFPEDLLATVETYTLDSMADARLLFDVFDAPLSVRSTTDYMTMCKAAYPDVQPLPSKFLVKMMDGIDLHEASRPDGQHIPARYRGDHFLAQPINREFVLWAHAYADAPNAHNSHFMGKVGIVAEMYGDFLADRPIATEFWGYLIMENHPDSNDETRDLARTLNELITRPRSATQNQFRNRVNKVWRRYFRIAMTERQRPLGPMPEAGFIVAEVAAPEAAPPA